MRSTRRRTYRRPSNERCDFVDPGPRAYRPSNNRPLNTKNNSTPLAVVLLTRRATGAYGRPPVLPIVPIANIRPDMATWTPAPELVDTAVALRGFAAVRDLAAQWRAEGIDVMVLKGPPLQARLYGTPAAYRSGDID